MDGYLTAGYNTPINIITLVYLLVMTIATCTNSQRDHS